MVKYSYFALCAILGGILVFSACSNTLAYEPQSQATQYSITVFPPPRNGTLKLSHTRAVQGTWVRVYVDPAPGFVLKEESLAYTVETANAKPKRINKEGLYFQWGSTADNVRVTATFEENKDSGKVTVSIDKNLGNGIIVADPLCAAPGTPITLYVIPQAEYMLKEDSFVIKDEQGNPLSGVTVRDALPHQFTLPNKNVVIGAEFTKGNFSSLLANAQKYVQAGQYDVAAAFYEEAYKNSSTGSVKDVNEVIFYSTLVKLGNILLDPNVQQFLGYGSMAMAVIPSTLEDWICDPDYWTGAENNIWYETWPKKEYDTITDVPYPSYAWAKVQFESEDIIMPKIASRIPGFPSPFGDYKLNSDNAASPQKFYNLMFWILVSSNTSGFNGFLEKVQSLFFGGAFEAAAARAATLPDDASVPLYQNLKKCFSLDKYYGSGPTNVGKAELNYIFGTLWAIKAAVEYLRAYEWSIDLRPWLTTEITRDDGLDQILDHIFAFAQENQNHRNYWADASTVAMILPLKNDFLKTRDASYTARAKSDFSKALAMIDGSMTYWHNSPRSNFSAAAKTNYQWAKAGVTAVKDAMAGKNSGNFYFPQKLPKPSAGAVWPTPAQSSYAINIDQFFTPGVFNLKNLITTENGGRTPSLFKVKWYMKDGEPVITQDAVLVTAPITDNGAQANVSGAYSAPCGIYTFEINTGNLRKIFPKGFEQKNYDIKKIDTAFLHQVFPTIPLWPERPSYFLGDNLAARNLYKYYH